MGWYHGIDNLIHCPMATLQTPFAYLDYPVDTDLSPLGFPTPVRGYFATHFQLTNTGAAPLTSCQIKSRCHPDAAIVDHVVTSPDWVPGDLIQDLTGNPFTLAAGASVNVILNLQAQFEILLFATCATSTTVTTRGTIFTPVGQ